MRTSSIPYVAISVLALAGCAGQAALPASRVADAPLVHTSFPPPAVSPESTRAAGDFSVHEITGNFRKHPALLTERVVAREDGLWIMDYRLEDTEGVRAVRVRMDDSGEIVKVSRMLDGVEEPGELADYESLMSAASVTPDENEGFTASSEGTCTVGPAELDCETKNYRVLVGGKEANLGITESRSLPGRDLAGEITAADGSVIYRSVLVEHGNEANKGQKDSLAMHLPPL
jgi:hypothetical protein